MTACDDFGGIVPHHLGLTAAPTVIATPLPGARMAISRLCRPADETARHGLIPADNGFVVTLHLADSQDRDFHRPSVSPARTPPFPRGSISINSISDRIDAPSGGALDALMFHIPRQTLDIVAQNASLLPVEGLTCPPGTIDPVLAHLGAALLPALAQPTPTATVFVNQLALPLLTHLVVTYGRQPLSARRTRGLLRWQLERAKGLLADTRGGTLLIGDVATACGLSRSYFIKAFRRSTGRTPHRWLTDHRIDKAKALLRENRPITEIALECGFADQSHFTRVFAAMVGLPPGAWRRHHQDEPEPMIGRCDDENETIL